MRQLWWAIIPLLFALLSLMPPAFTGGEAQASAANSVLAKLVDEADSIVVGTVVERSSYWNDEHTDIYTSVVLSVGERLKGTASQDTVTILLQGGQVGEVGEWLSDMPSFEPGERAVALLKKLTPAQLPKATGATELLAGEQFEVCGGFRGKFAIKQGKVGTLPETEFKSRLSKAIRGEALSTGESDSFWSQTEQQYAAFTLTGFSWPHPPPPVVPYLINENTDDCEGEGAAVQAAAATWNAAGACFSFAYDGSTTVTEYNHDGVNDIFWGTGLSWDTLAATQIWLSGDSDVVECNVKFNDPNYDWKPDEQHGEYFIEAVALHEFGHWLYLDHSTDPTAVMWQYYQGLLNLAADDIAGIQAIYGISAPPTTPAVTNGSGESNVTSTSARLNGEVTDTGNQNPTVHIYWGDNDGGTDPGSWDHDEDLGAKGAGAFYIDVNTLTPNTNYFYRCFAQNSAGSDWADSTEPFTTLVHTDKLIGTDTAGSSSVAAGKLILGKFQATQTGNVTEIHVYSRANGKVKVAIYEDNAGIPTTLLNANDTSPTPVTAGQWNTISITSTPVTSGNYYWLAVANDNSGATSFSTSGGTSKGKAITFSSFSFASNPTGLTSYTYRRAFAGWGITPLAVTTNTATGVGDQTATLNATLTGLGADTQAQVKFEYGTDTSYDTEILALQSPMSSPGNFSADLTSLTNGQEYHYRAMATGTPSNNTVHGGDMTFTPNVTPERLIGTDIAGSSNVGAGKLILGKFQATQTGNITEIRVYSRASGKVKVAIYEDSSNSPGNLLKANNTATPVTAGQWNTIPIDSTAITQNAYYWLAVANDNSGATSYSGAGTGTSKGKAITFSSFTFASNPTGLSSYTYRRAFAGWGDITAPTTQRLIGTDTAGSSSVAAGKLILGKFQATQTGDVTEIRVHSRANGKVKVAIYEDNAGMPTTLLKANNSAVVVTGGQWNTIPIDSTPVTQNNYYWLAVANDNSGATSFSTSGGTSKGKAITFSSFSFSSNPTGLTSYTYRRAFAGWGTPVP